jgi:hypothetical protein
MKPPAYTLLTALVAFGCGNGVQPDREFVLTRLYESA